MIEAIKGEYLVTVIRKHMIDVIQECGTIEGVRSAVYGLLACANLSHLSGQPFDKIAEHLESINPTLADVLWCAAKREREL